jgi:SagB-type dehydrogenase family enzyme
MADPISEYHDKTSYTRNRLSGHFMDRTNQPDQFKTYSGVNVVELPKIGDWPGKDLSRVLAGTIEETVSIDLDTVARSLFLAHTVTAKAKLGDTEFLYRSVASAGALYPSELYLGALDVAGLDPGLYHHEPKEARLAQIRQGAFTRSISHMDLPDDTPYALWFFITAIFFRSAWKYRDRAYRYHLLDSGHLEENLIQSLHYSGLKPRVHLDFNDESITEFLCLDPQKEVCLAVISAGPPTPTKPDQKADALKPPLELEEESTTAPRETPYEVISEFHALTEDCSNSENTALMSKDLGVFLAGPTVEPEENDEPMSFYEEAVLRRRSMRNFVKESIPAGPFSMLLRLLSMPADWNGRNAKEPIAVGALIGAVEGIEPGFYLLDFERRALDLVKSGSFIAEMAHICLDQAWLANCGAHFMFLSNLATLNAAWGPRGYRYAMMTAGRLGQRLYVGATSLKIGCCGIGAFYDDEAQRLLALGADSRLLYVVATGMVKKWVGS